MRRRRLHRRERKLRNKKIIIASICLICIMSVGFAAFQTQISLTAKGNVYKSEDKCYTVSDNGDDTCTITDYDKTCGSDVVIPETIKGKTVTKIGDTTHNSYKVFNQKGLTSVVIPDTVIYIGNYSFWTNNLKSVTLGKNVSEIGNEAFAVNNLYEITFPQSLKSIKSGAFRNNYLSIIPDLTNIEYGTGAFTCNAVTGENAYVYKKNDDGTIDKTTLNSYAGNCYYPTDFSLPTNIKNIAQLSIRLIQIDTLNLPEGIESLNWASLMQANVSTVNIPSSITYIDNQAFWQATSIKVININRKENAISGSPWGATNATVNWTGTE